ncbi:glycoside hydrolase family 68 protein [Sphingomonas sp. BGYR3]|uniref:glycoside hydrolase family 68 protein n=1 Tax=Sphingomonas sp. BGYR3 TaxID=2975483 RepID=UPI0021A962CC|nr:glycoside hydrolase family 68 protein [Sphingomonas sp. BGYR3]MDG5488795.1 glycoside hydrolase family 68 protein [Sphingomonas sp. BGYR3]
MSPSSAQSDSTKATTPLSGTGTPRVSQWNADMVARIGDGGEAPRLIGEADIQRISNDLDIWDAWPVQDRGGAPARIGGDGDTLWMALGAPRFDDPDQRHGHARIHLLLHRAGKWQPLGPAMPDGFSPGSREWSGSAVLDDDGHTLLLYFTATGRRGEATESFEQRLFTATATLTGAADGYALTDWRALREIVALDPAHYMPTTGPGGGVGTIKAFRDPAYFLDRDTGLHHLFFAGSQAGSSSPYNGVIGSAQSHDGEQWVLTAPLLSADRLNNELERPHVVRREGRYYLFWSTQRHVFNPEGPAGPTGLYGAVADSLADGQWRPINGTGLIFMNPGDAPRQAYSWLVLPDLSVISFIDDWGMGERTGPDRRFGATFAPTLRLWVDGDRAGLAQE